MLDLMCEYVDNQQDNAAFADFIAEKESTEADLAVVDSEGL